MAQAEKQDAVQSSLSSLDLSGKTVFEGPKCLIEAYQGEFKVNEETLDEIATIYKTLVVVTIAGIYRTGKSYLLTRLAGKYEGFPLGNTIQSKTKGIWAWCINHPQDNDKMLLLLDTEGLGDIEKGDEHHDSKIFTMATLLSSTLVYNATGAFNQDALKKLSFVVSLAKNIQTSKAGDGSEEADAELDVYLPDFVLVVRDFSLELKIDGVDINPDQYLEHCIKNDPGKNESYNEPRLQLRKYFKRRKCFVMVQPGNHKKLKQLASLTDKDLEEDFVEQVHLFIQYIYGEAKPFRTRNDTGINGRMFSTLARQYVDAISSGKIPCIESTMEEMAKRENFYIIQSAFEAYLNKMENLRLPTQEELDFVNAHTQAKALADDIYLKGAVMDEQLEYKTKLKNQIKEKYQLMKDKNKRLSREQCRGKLKELQGSFYKKLNSGRYFEDDGLSVFEQDMNNIQREYEASSEVTFMKNDVLIEFLKESEKDKMSIVLKLDDRKKELELERFEKEKEEIEEKAKKQRELEQTRILNETIKIEDDMKREMENLKKKMEEDMEREKEKTKMALEKKEEEIKRLEEEGLKQKADMERIEKKQVEEKQEKRERTWGDCVYDFVTFNWW